MSHDIYVIRSAASPWTEPGSVGEDLRSVAEDGRREIEEVGASLLEVIKEPIKDVRFAPAHRTRSTALGVIALTYSSIELRRDKRLIDTDPAQIKEYLESITDGPTVLFTHLDVVQAMVAAVGGEQLNDELIPTASLTRICSDEHGMQLVYAGKTIDEALREPKR